LALARNLAAYNRTQMVLSHDSSSIVSNGQQFLATSARQPSVTVIHPIIA